MKQIPSVTFIPANKRGYPMSSLFRTTLAPLTALGLLLASPVMAQTPAPDPHHPEGAPTTAAPATPGMKMPMMEDGMTPMMSQMMVDKHMKMMDTNGDGLISKEEHKKGAEKMFKDADTNGDNMVSKQEMMDKKMKDMKDMGMMKDGMMDKK
ncbi:MAG: hypothetical protein ACSLFB_14250 [Acidimicrobiales bacterium]